MKPEITSNTGGTAKRVHPSLTVVLRAEEGPTVAARFSTPFTGLQDSPFGRAACRRAGANFAHTANPSARCYTFFPLAQENGVLKRPATGPQQGAAIGGPIQGRVGTVKLGCTRLAVAHKPSFHRHMQAPRFSLNLNLQPSVGAHAAPFM